MDKLDQFARDVVQKIVFGDAVMRLLRYVINDVTLPEVLASHVSKSHPQLIDFPHLTQLLCDTLLSHDGSLNHALQTWERDKQTLASRQAYYGKLRRMPLEASRAFFLHATSQLRGMHAEKLKSSILLPACFDKLGIRILDGKELKRIAKRLLATQGSPGKLLGGMLLVGWDPRSQLVDMVAMSPDGHANECSLVESCMDTLRGSTQRHLLVLDQQFGDVTQPARIADAGHDYLIRHHPKTHFHPDLQVPEKVTHDAAGRTIRDRVGTLGSGPQALRVRHLTVERPDEEPVRWFTSLMDQETYSAVDLLELYRYRWDIEDLFREVTTTFGLKKFVGSTPEAVIFQSMLCLLLANIVYLVQGYVAASRQLTCREISTKNLMREVRRDLTSLFHLVSVPVIEKLIPRELDAAKLREWLTKRLAGGWKDLLVKAVENKPRTKRTKLKEPGAHRSVQRLIDKHRENNTKIDKG
jgi:hypothetical protein